MTRPYNWLFIVICAAVFSCSSTPPSRYYLLDATIAGLKVGDTSRKQEEQRNIINIGLSAIELPGYIDRTRMVRRTGPNTLVVDQFDLWSEPLDEGVQRVIAANLSSLLGDVHLHSFPWPRGTEPDYRVTVSVARFDPTEDGPILLQGTWSLTAAERPAPATENTYDIFTPSRGEANADIAAAMSEALAELSRDIAQTIVQYRSIDS